MRPAVVTAVLLLVCTLDTETASQAISRPCRCGRYPRSQCREGWSYINENRCAKLIGSPKTFHEAQEHCSTLNGDLVSINSPGELAQVLCLTWCADSHPQRIWIGATRSEGGFRYTDGSEFEYARWFPGEPNNSDGQEACVELNFDVLGYYNDARCSEKKNFMCAKKI